MLVVKVELWPFGDENKKEDLGKVIFYNDGTGTTELANYNVKFEHTFIKRKSPVISMLRIDGFKKQAGFWRLVNMALTKMLKEVRVANRDK